MGPKLNFEERRGVGDLNLEKGDRGGESSRLRGQGGSFGTGREREAGDEALT